MPANIHKFPPCSKVVREVISPGILVWLRYKPRTPKWPPSRHHDPSLEPMTTMSFIGSTERMSLAPSAHLSILYILSESNAEYGI